MPEALPIDPRLPEIAAALRLRGGCVVVAAPGAGKTTRVPPYLATSGVAKGTVVVLEPRRVAARAAAARISEERGDVVGGFAGYVVRFERKVSPQSRVVVVTEGVLTRRLQDDPSLEGVGVVVLDEFHERSIHADLALALLKEVRESLRPDLKIVVMSATLDAEAVATYLDAPIVSVEGRTYPVDVAYLDVPDDRPLHIRVAAGVRRALDHDGGDVLAFLPGRGEIARAAEAVEPLARERGFDVVPLHGELSSAEQDRALAKGPRRKVVLATNVAETSVTVPGVTTVVDSGFARVLAHDPDAGLDRLELKRVSRASATQRAGRAGRVAPGRALRLWTKAEETTAPERETPEIRRVDLSATALDLRTWGSRDPATFGWFEAPDPAALARADELLRDLGAIDAAGAPTPLGRRLATLPAPPRTARLLLAAAEFGVAEDGAIAAAILSERDAAFRAAERRAGSSVGLCDVGARVERFKAAESGRDAGVDRATLRAVGRAKEHFLRLLGPDVRGARRAAADDPEEALRRALFVAFPDRAARRRAKGSDEALMVGGRGLKLAPESVVRDAEFFLAIDADLGRRGAHARALVRVASAIEREWLLSAGGAACAPTVETTFDSARGRVVGRRVVRFRDLPIEEGETGSPDPAEATRLLMAEIRRDPEIVFAKADAATALLDRIAALSEWTPELGLPELSKERVVDALEPWIDGRTSLDDVRATNVADVVRSLLTEAQRRALDEHAPEAIVVPSGMRRALRYEKGRPPVLAVKLQELFGLSETPRVGLGRVPVLLHLLAPNGTPVQVTQDLRSFWNSTYAQVRKDLRGRYPKHPWPEDPWNAPPTHRAKPRRPS